MILIISIRGDLHSLAVQHGVRRRGYEQCHIVECDNMGGSPTLLWKSWTNPSESKILTSENITISLEDVSVIWWRRVRADQLTATYLTNDHERDIVNNDCRGALAGILAATFSGEWISRPEATDRAADKLFQLSIAQRAGFRIPRTMVSQSRGDVAEFFRQEKKVIVKPVVGARGPLLYTQFINDPLSIPEQSFVACPAVYQEYIEGRRHIRMNCFGDDVNAALIETVDLDWRPNLNVPVSKWTVPDTLAQQVRSVLQQLGLRMGIVDIKLTPDGEPVWLEVNPQGQFLFLEPLLGEPLTERFVDFLLLCLRERDR
ncbi:MAG: ATP-grasp domain-containing protein [Pseudonocardiaceae bacterium]